MVTTTLKTPAPPPSDLDANDDRDRPEKNWSLDDFGEFALTPKLMALTKDVNRALCEK